MNGNVANSSETSAPNVITTNVFSTQGVGIAINNEVVVIRTTILIILLLFSLIGNSFIVLSVAQASKVRFNPFNAFLLSLAAYGVVECAMTMSLAIGFSVEQKWIFGDFLKGFNASFIQLHNVGVMLTLAAMAMDRYIAVGNVSNYHTQSSVHRANYIVLYTWIHGFLFALPIMFQNQMLGVRARAFVERCLCGLVEGTTIVFTSLTIALCLVIPFLATMVFLCLIILRSIKERKKLVSSNTAQFADCLFQESALLKEARCTQYVTVLILMFLLFKIPYITVDVLTQQSVSFAYHSVNSTSHISSNAIDDNTQFYYQTAIVWMLFCFSALYPIVTFIYFDDHWRRLRNWLICQTTTISIANRHGNGANLRHIRQKQKRNKHHQRMANRNSNINNNTGTKHSSKPSTMSRHKKAPSTISSNILSEKIAVNGLSTQGPEVLFRVPVLYAATDGLHLVASEKTLGRKHLNGKEDVSLQNQPTTSSVTTQSQAVDLKQSFSATCLSSVIQAEPILKQADISNLRPSSAVVDTRIDVTGSIDGVNEEEMSYFMSVAEIENDTESELNDSANSRTLIWPHHCISNGKSNSVWAEMRTPSSYQNIKFSDHTDENENDDVSVSHPNTPTPPGEEVGYQITAKMSSHGLFDSDKTVINKTVLNKLPVMKSKNIAAKHFHPLSGPSQNGLLLVESLEECDDGILNTGYETVSKIQFKTNDVLPKESFGHSRNKVHPNSPPLIFSTSNGASAWNVARRCQTNSVQACITGIGKMQTEPEGEILYTTTASS